MRASGDREIANLGEPPIGNEQSGLALPQHEASEMSSHELGLSAGQQKTNVATAYIFDI
jgi:hypothetical protein